MTKAKCQLSRAVVTFNDFSRPLWCSAIIRGLQKLNNKALNLIDFWKRCNPRRYSTFQLRWPPAWWYQCYYACGCDGSVYVCVCACVSDCQLMLRLHPLSIISKFSTIRNNAHTGRMKQTNVSIRNPSIRLNPSDCALRSETASWALNWFRCYWLEGIIFKLVFSNKRALKERSGKHKCHIDTEMSIFQGFNRSLPIEFFFFVLHKLSSESACPCLRKMHFDWFWHP